MSKPLTEKQVRILMEMFDNGSMTPTEIGIACDREHDLAASWACSGLKALEQNGYVKKVVNTKPHKVSYELTKEGELVVGDLIDTLDAHESF